MFSSIAISALLYFSAALASPLASPACTTLLAGNLSPNGLYGNFKVLNGNVVWDPNEIETPFDVSLISCGGAANSSNPSGQLQASGQCLSVASDSIVQAAACPSASNIPSFMTWKMSQGFLFWSGPVSAECPSGLYGYIATDASGTPAAPQDTPLTLGCETASNVFGFSLLI